MNAPLADYYPWLEWIKTQKERMIRLVIKWSEISSHSYDVNGLSAMMDALRLEMAPLSKEIQTFSLSPQSDFTEDGRMIQRALGSAISFRTKRLNTPSVLLNGHLDTVYRKDFFFPTVKLSPTLLQGPGVADLKGGLVVALIALEALERSPFARSLSWELFCNPDEEVGSTGSYPFMKACATQHDCAFIFEPALPDGRFVSSRNGSANYCILSKGCAAHAGRDFEKGYSAILPLLPLIEKLTQISNPKEGVILSIGIIQGGSAINSVPQNAMIRFTLRTKTEEQMKQAQAQIRASVDASKNAPFPFSLLELSSRPPKPLSVKQGHFFDSVAERATLLSIPMVGGHSGGVCDGNFFASFGLPTIDTMGPIGGHLHTEQEYLDLESLVPKATLMALILMQIASGEFSLKPLSPRYPEGAL